MLFHTLLTAAAIAHASVLPQHQPRDECTNPPRKVEWRRLGAADKQAYIDAVLCLGTKPSLKGLASSLYDDFSLVHFQLSKTIHGSAPFLPWHRYFLHVYETALRECGYEGPGTYWDWTLDTAGLLTSPVMSPETGFGGNGSPNRTEISPDGGTLLCVDSGPFSRLRPKYLAISPTEVTDEGHCLWRDLPEVSEPSAFETMASLFAPDAVAQGQTAKDFGSYARPLEGGPHGMIHASLGGDMNPTTSPNDPLFFLHHAQIDRLWWLWQQEDPSARLLDYTGDRYLSDEADPLATAAVTLDDLMMMNGLDDDIPVRDVMNTQNSRLCYSY